MRAAAVALVLTVTAVVPACTGAPGPAREGPPNVLLIVVDTLRADRLGCYGYDRETSPRIDALARRGVRFDEFRAAASSTLASFTSILTGLYPNRHGVYRNGVVWPEGLTGVQSLFAGAGYETAGFVASYCLTSPFGLSRGFEHFDERLDVALPDMPSNKLIRRGAGVTRAVEDWLEARDAGRPFFAMVHYFDPHWPYRPPRAIAASFDPDYEGAVVGSFADRNRLRDRLMRNGGAADRDTEHLHALHLGEIRYTDAQVGALLDALERHVIADDTLVVLTADHGESIYEHGDYFNHGLTVYDTNIRVPLVVRGPGVDGEGRVVEAVLSSVDLTPTLLDLTGIGSTSAGEGGFDGRSFAGLLSSRSSRSVYVPRAVFAEATRPHGVEAGQSWPNRLKARAAVGPDRVKVIEWPWRSGLRQAFDLSSDPGELRDLVGTRDAASGLAARFAELAEWSERLPGDVPGAPEATPEVLERLRSLGYVD